jgi:hypothetical protein
LFSPTAITQREAALSLLLKYETLFDGTLGDWNHPLTVTEILDAQKADTKLKQFFKQNATLDKGRIKNASVTKEGWSYPSHCNGKQRCGAITISSTRGTPVLKRQ